MTVFPQGSLPTESNNRERIFSHPSPRGETPLTWESAGVLEHDDDDRPNGRKGRSQHTRIMRSESSGSKGEVRSSHQRWLRLRLLSPKLSYTVMPIFCSMMLNTLVPSQPPMTARITALNGEVLPKEVRLNQVRSWHRKIFGYLRQCFNGLAKIRRQVFGLIFQLSIADALKSRFLNECSLVNKATAREITAWQPERAAFAPNKFRPNFANVPSGSQ